MAGIFGKKTTREEAVQKKDSVIKTGGKIDGNVYILVSAVEV